MSELNKAVADILVKATQAAEAAGKFAMEQLPDVAQQYVTYVALYSWIMVIIGLLAAMVPPAVLWKLLKDEHPGDRMGATVMVGTLTGFIGTLFVLFNLKEAVMATVAPKALLIQWAASLVK